jgi:hypothetical protein
MKEERYLKKCTLGASCVGILLRAAVWEASLELSNGFLSPIPRLAGHRKSSCNETARLRHRGYGGVKDD